MSELTVSRHAPEGYCCSDLGECVCGPEERGLRAIIAGRASHMTADDREWCLREIERVEGHERAHHDGAGDRDLARGVLAAWTDFCRDKGLLP